MGLIVEHMMDQDGDQDYCVETRHIGTWIKSRVWITLTRVTLFDQVVPKL